MHAVSVVVALALAVISSCCWADEPQGTLKKIIDTRVIRLGYQKDVAPFSFAGADGRPSGYSIDLCHRIVAGIRNEFGLGLLDIEWIELTLADRFQRVADGTIDLECAASAITLSRHRQVDFSAMIWIDSKTFLVKRGQSVKTLADLAGKRVAVAAGTTNEKVLREVLLGQVLDGGAVTTEVVLVKDHHQGLDALVRGSIHALAADRMVLARLAQEGPDPQQLLVADYPFAYEPLALTLRRNDADFKFAVNQVLAGLYRTGAVKQIYNRWFSKLGSPRCSMHCTTSMACGTRTGRADLKINEGGGRCKQYDVVQTNNQVANCKGESSPSEPNRREFLTASARLAPRPYFSGSHDPQEAHPGIGSLKSDLFGSRPRPTREP